MRRYHKTLIIKDNTMNTLTDNDLKELKDLIISQNKKIDQLVRDTTDLKFSIVELKGELKEDIAELKGELKEDIAELKGDIKTLKSHKMKLSKMLQTSKELNP